MSAGALAARSDGEFEPDAYTARHLLVLEGLEAVRKRPGMYIGGVGASGLHHLVWEILDNSIDEAMNGYASNITVTLHEDGTSITIADDGRGIPVDKHPKTKKSAVEVIFTTLHAGGKFEAGNYKTAGGLHGVGASVVNALSKELVATIRRDGAEWELRFKQGQPVGAIKKNGPARGTGTVVFFRPDSTIFPKIEFDPETIKQRLEVSSYLHKGVKIVFDDATRSEKQTFQHSEGLSDYLKTARRSGGLRRGVRRRQPCPGMARCRPAARPSPARAPPRPGRRRGSAALDDSLRSLRGARCPESARRADAGRREPR